MSESKKWTVIFLIDASPQSRILLLKRSAGKSFAPNFYIGIGGKIGDLKEFENESPIEGAYRELKEETMGTLGKENTSLHEFARTVYGRKEVIHYFCGVIDPANTPKADPNDGTLEWVEISKLLDFDIIPTTKKLCTEWSKREFALDKPFTLYLKGLEVVNTVRLVEFEELKDGLVD